MVADYFAADEPLVISSLRSRWTLKNKNNSDPTTAFGNTRGVPVPEWFQEDVLEVGGLRFVMDRIHMHQRGDYLVFLDKTDPLNADSGTYDVLCGIWYMLIRRVHENHKGILRGILSLTSLWVI